MSAKNSMNSIINNNIPVITIDSEEEEDNDNDIEIIEEIHANCSAINKSNNDLKPMIVSNESTNVETLPINCTHTSTHPLIRELNDKLCHKRIIPKQIESIASTSVSTNSDISLYMSTSIDQMFDNTNGVPHKVKRIVEPNNMSTETKLDANQLYENYLKSFRDRMSVSEGNNSEELINKLSEIMVELRREKPVFLKSSQFAKLMKVNSKDVSQEKDNDSVVRIHNDLLKELKRIVLKPNNNINQIKISKNIKEKRLKQLTETIKKLQKEIFAAENEELDYEALEGKSVYIYLPKLYKRLEEVWIKRETMLKRSTVMFRPLFKQFKYNSSLYPDINSAVEKLFNNFIKKLKNWDKKGYRDETFTFIDVHKAITQVIKDKGLDIQNSNEMCEQIYIDLMKELRTRRNAESEDVFETLETLDDLKPELFVSNDPAIDIELSKNKSAFERKLQELFQKFTEKDRAKNGDCLEREGVHEWDQSLVDNEEFETLDVKNGDLEDEESDKDDDECSLGSIEVQENSVAEQTTSTDDNCLRDLTNN